MSSQRPSGWYAVPAFAFFALFAALPMVIVVYLSFTAWDGLGTPAPNGVDNWTRLVQDGEATASVGRTVLLMVVSWLVQTPIALLVGVWAAGKQRSRAVLSSIFFLPLLLSTAAIALLWQVLLDPNFGAFVGGPQFLGDTDIAIYTVVFVISWQYIPFHTLLYQGAARAVPPTLYEAATIDGAGRFGQFVNITLPQLRFTIVTSSVLMMVGSLTTFDTVLILTNGGPGTATRILPLHMYITGFVGFEMGYASTIAVVLVVLGTALSVAVMRWSGFRSMSSQQEGS
ncbi:carbohydrate ABC transporter permease [Saccharothrix longispora]|uniref:Raffinose/stachyose/melibiose transport system permease protein/xylobiose transport system permease protein n=1 Tax=Saccharothrix longispora TaxID=33920 RepID=A0ABU1PND6_9PSEU|nr:sugar ABC transporter permease [Saccharothrix longispora]MDR6592174.1 raffinose/stachyose/melibiose transport system permease protein/xylobiose transport system permease protein [Saccharothrix longispora]MDU0292069.1 sugar ABC transporter permease [Saccharothrix longispora]